MTGLYAMPSDTAHALDKARLALQAALADQSSVDLSWIQPPPSVDGWALAPDALRFVARLVRHLRPRHVLEFGAGLSTRVLARSAREADLICAISSVDHDPEFGALPLETVQEAGSQVSVAHQLAPMVARTYGGELLPVYWLDARRLASPQPPDLVLIDGPPITLGGRVGTLYQILDYMRPGTLVLLDDADRRSECRAIAHWQDSLGDAIEVMRLPGFSRGMAAILIHKSLHSDALWDHRLDMTRRQIVETVPAGAPFILVDHDLWADAWPDGRRAVHFVDRNGESWGLPLDDTAAIAELEERRREGAMRLIIVWPAFWWLDYYAEFQRVLRAKYRCVLENERLIVFDLH